MMIKLQSIRGFVPAKRADSFSPGEKMLWNFGEMSEVVGKVSETPKTILLTIRHGGKVYNSRFLKGRMVAIG